MRLYLAVAVMMLAFVAYTEAQDQTIEQRFAQFTEQVANAGRDLADRATSTLDQIKNSKFATETQTWAERQMQILTEKFSELTQ